MVKVARYVYAVAAWLFVFGVAVQVFLAGMVVVAARMGWGSHVGLGHMLAGPLILMLISMYLGRQPRNIKWLTWGLFGAYVLQSDILIFMRGVAPVAAAFHPVLALVDFALGFALARQALPLARQVTRQPALELRPQKNVPEADQA
jgi:hypothetical protein